MSENDSRRDRKEPTLGNLDQLDASAARPGVRPGQRPGQRRTRVKKNTAAQTHQRGPADEHRMATGRFTRMFWVLGTLALLIILGALAWFNQGALRALLPPTRMNALLKRADTALARGHLESTDGTGARSLYEGARALEPDNERALRGLRKVGQAELARARKALVAHHYAQAQQNLGNARALLGGGSAVESLAQKIAHAQQSQAQTNAIIEEAQSQRKAGNLSGDQGAAALYRKALAVDPANAVARHGLEQVGDAWAAQARAALRKGDLDAASSQVERIAAAMPHYGDLPSLRAAVTQARKKAQEVTQKHLDEARRDMQAGRFTGSGDDNALAQYRAVLETDADNAQARAGLGQVAQALVVQANAAIDSQDFQQASQLLTQAAKLAPKSADLAAAQSRLKSVKAQVQAPSAGPGGGNPALPPKQQAKIDALLKRAHAAARAGDIMLPPGACAYDLYRQALTIDANNPGALQGLQSLAGRATQLFQTALKAGHLDRADSMLDTLEQLDPGDSAHDALRHRLASAYLDRAEKRIGNGDDAGARKDLHAARKLAPESPRLQALSIKLGGA